jgi:hypothetical protein
VADFFDMAPRKKRIVTDEHKAAMAEGRTQSRAVSSYLEALDLHRPKRGRKRTTDSIDKRLATIDAELPGANPIKRLSLIQERLDLANERETLGSSVDISAYEDEFVAAAGPYSDRKGISYAAWRELGVPPAILKRAGISRSA